jgi:hypothetical protein
MTSTERSRAARIAVMQAILERTCAEFNVDEKYKARATELLPLAAKLGTSEFTTSAGGYIYGVSAEAIVHGLIYLVIMDGCGVGCSLVADKMRRALYKQQPLYKQQRHRKANKILRYLRLATGITGHSKIVLPRSVVNKIPLLPDEVDDIRALLADPFFLFQSVGKIPAGITAAIIYLYLKRRRVKTVPQNFIAKIFGISDVCMRMRILEIRTAADTRNEDEESS